MRRPLLTLVCLLWATPPALAQPVAVPASQLGWDQTAAGSGAANAYRYTLYIDALPSVVLTATCTGTAPLFQCVAPLPAMTPGLHTLQLTAAEVVSPTQILEGLRSDPFQIRVAVAPAPPALLRIVGP